MIQIHLAKSALEHEEGINVLWIQLAPLPQARKTCVQLYLPPGIHRARNLNDMEEDSSGILSIPEPQAAADLFIEIFTREPIVCGMYSITIEVTYTDEAGAATSVKRGIPLKVVADDEAAELVADPEVVRRVKELQRRADTFTPDPYIEYPPAKLIRLDASQMSEWEKKYRVDGAIEL
ncbi:hypothetical protein [Paenibacillus piscarius]|uniref:hypothetical protein n=1 Tax=Paenibacillus piscarius TaxID=1089681 RepID=UPI001EE79932|nr:hypothetical protein [Paenibacillus piscarius]